MVSTENNYTSRPAVPCFIVKQVLLDNKYHLIDRLYMLLFEACISKQFHELVMLVLSL